jgi:hypothetical protein
MRIAKREHSMRLEITAGMLAIATVAFAQDTKPKPKMMPYTTVDNPQFVPAAQASFLSSDYVLIGIVTGSVAKAYPAADLTQHGVVQDQMPDGPIAVTW